MIVIVNEAVITESNKSNFGTKKNGAEIREIVREVRVVKICVQIMMNLKFQVLCRIGI